MRLVHDIFPRPAPSRLASGIGSPERLFRTISDQSQEHERTCVSYSGLNSHMLGRVEPGAAIMQRHSRVGQARHESLKSQYCRNTHCLHIADETRIAVTGATEVHRALCAPEWQRVGDYEIASRVVPARHVSGDFVYSLQQEDETFFVLGDLMGKGLSAAMWITHIVDLVHRSAEGSHDVCDLLRRLNMEILHSRVRAPLTSAVAISIDSTNDTISCALAGHPPAILLRSDTGIENITAGGPLLGAFSCARYECQRVHLKTGESIIAFSDGLIEAVNENHEEFTIKSVTRLAAKEAASAPAVKISRLLAASTALAGENPLDDISIMVLQHS